MDNFVDSTSIEVGVHEIRHGLVAEYPVGSIEVGLVYSCVKKTLIGAFGLDHLLNVAQNSQLFG